MLTERQTITDDTSRGDGAWVVLASFKAGSDPRAPPTRLRPYPIRLRHFYRIQPAQTAYLGYVVVSRTPTAGEQSSTPINTSLIRIILILLRGLPFKPVTESTGSSVAARHTFVILRRIKLCSGPRLSSAGKDGSRMCRSARRRHIKGNSSSSATTGISVGEIPVLDSRIAIES